MRNFPLKRQKKGTMNKTEARYAEKLYLRMLAGEINRYQFEGVRFKLAKNSFYTPDFYIVTPDSVEIHEVKGGYITEAGKLRFKIAANTYPEYKWELWQNKSIKAGWERIMNL